MAVIVKELLKKVNHAMIKENVIVNQDIWVTNVTCVTMDISWKEKAFLLNAKVHSTIKLSNPMKSC